MAVIYRIWNKKNNKSYIGQTVDVNSRIVSHFSPKSAIWEDVLEYGVDAFDWEILERCPVDQLNRLEDRYISDFNALKTGYNRRPGGDRCLTLSHTKNEEVLSDNLRRRIERKVAQHKGESVDDGMDRLMDKYPYALGYRIIDHSDTILESTKWSCENCDWSGNDEDDCSVHAATGHTIRREVQIHRIETLSPSAESPGVHRMSPLELRNRHNESILLSLDLRSSLLDQIDEEDWTVSCPTLKDGVSIPKIR